MTEKTIQITEFDRKRLLLLLSSIIHVPGRGPDHAGKLRAELARAHIVAPQAIPATVITMNSTAHVLDLETGVTEELTLVFPERADGANGKISILAPLGMAMLGYEIGDIFEWEVPAGKRRWQVKDVVYQPEASGHYHM